MRRGDGDRRRGAHRAGVVLLVLVGAPGCAAAADHVAARPLPDGPVTSSTGPVAPDGQAPPTTASPLGPLLSTDAATLFGYYHDELGAPTELARCYATAAAAAGVRDVDDLARIEGAGPVAEALAAAQRACVTPNDSPAPATVNTGSPAPG